MLTKTLQVPYFFTIVHCEMGIQLAGNSLSFSLSLPPSLPLFLYFLHTNTHIPCFCCDTLFSSNSVPSYRC